MKALMRIAIQAEGMSLSETLQGLPKASDVEAKKNSKDYKTSWMGDKLHIDSANEGIPISCALTSASTHDSQVAIPLVNISSERVTNLYDLMDYAYDVSQSHENSRQQGHVLLIDQHPRRDNALTEQLKAKIQTPLASRSLIG